MSEKLNKLKKEADGLGVKYSPNIGEATLQDKIDAAKEMQSGPEAELKAQVESLEKSKEKEKSSTSSAKFDYKTVDLDTLEPALRMRVVARRAEDAARKTKVVTIIDNDQRQNNQTTSCTVNCGNENFDLGTAVLPLNMEVEVKQGHLNVLKEVKIPQHVKDPKTGLSTWRVRPRYSIVESDKKPTQE